MKSWRPRRPLTDLEKRLHDQNLCIICGQPVVKEGFFECVDCFRQRVQCATDDKVAHGIGGASLGHEFRRRLGYSSGDGAAPCTPAASDGTERMRVGKRRSH